MSVVERRKRIFSNQEYTMQTIKNCIFGLILFPLISYGQTDSECLKQLGGAFYNVECYGGLSNDLEDENKLLIRKILATIPPKNRNRTLLSQYSFERKKLDKYCTLARDSMSEWKPGKATVNPRYFDYDTAYSKCLYESSVFQNRFLKTLLENITQENDESK